MASTYLQRNASGTQSNQKIWTHSGWYKKSSNGNENTIFMHETTSGHTQKWEHKFNSGDYFYYGWWDGTNEYAGRTNSVYRDTNGWYHIVVRMDTTQSTADDRLRIYINGEQLTNWNFKNNPAQNAQLNLAQHPMVYGRYQSASPGNYFNGSMSHIHFCDGYSYAPTEFGETDANGVWKIKTSPSVSYGNLGHFILKDGNSVTDQSGNSNNFTVGGGTLTNTEDNPSNVFATLNPLAGSTDATFIAGNTTAYFGTASSRSILTSTLGAVSGKYYWECKIGGNVSPNNATLGVGLSSSYTADSNPVGYKSDSWGYKGWDGTVFNNSSSVGGTWSTFGDGDIIGVAVNLDNEQGGLNKLYFSKNGVWQNGADPSNFTSATGVVGITKPENGDTGFLFAQFGDGGSSATPRFEVNFGNGYFQQTAVSSAGTNASGNGVFEYDVPTGYTALSTKGLNL